VLGSENKLNISNLLDNYSGCLRDKSNIRNSAWSWLESNTWVDCSNQLTAVVKNLNPEVLGGTYKGRISNLTNANSVLLLRGEVLLTLVFDLDSSLLLIHLSIEFLDTLEHSPSSENCQFTADNFKVVRESD
jgi:hypothetical protein